MWTELYRTPKTFPIRPLECEISDVYEKPESASAAANVLALTIYSVGPFSPCAYAILFKTGAPLTVFAQVTFLARTRSISCNRRWRERRVNVQRDQAQANRE
jgi:hypothetical protein